MKSQDVRTRYKGRLHCPKPMKYPRRRDSPQGQHSVRLMSP
nr:MAG TPA_asm: hypothetical protein [Caudoviricetes sp.]